MKRTILTLLTLALFLAGSAQQRSESEALAIAEQYLNKVSHPQKARRLVAAQKADRKDVSQSPARPAKQTTDAPYYVFNDDANKSFVLVSGDERMLPVLGYSDNGVYDKATAPAALQEMLSQYEAQYQYLQLQKVKENKEHEAQGPTRIQRDAMAQQMLQMPAKQKKVGPVPAISFKPVAPLLTTQWGQGYPYNKYCPTYKDDNCVTGCVATAMAQVMNYYKYPEVGQGELQYYSDSYNLYSYANFTNAKYYDWVNKRDTYEAGTYSEAEANAVANLMYACGVSVGMDYTPKGTGAYACDIPYAMIHYFNYSPNTVFVQRSYYSRTEWMNKLYGELQAERPIIYSATSAKEGGHCFVLDGVKDSTMFHVNWGWNGNSDGYFALDAFDPANDGYGFDFEAAAICNLYPSEVGTKENTFYADKFATTYSTLSSSAIFTFTNVWNFSSCTTTVLESTVFEGAIGVAQYDEDFQFVKVLAKIDKSLGMWYGNRTLNLAVYKSDLDFSNNQTCYLVPVSIEESTDLVCPIRTGDYGWTDYVIATQEEDGTVSLSSRFLDKPFLIDGIWYGMIVGEEGCVEVQPAQSGTYSGDIVIPETIEYAGVKYTVTGVAESAFEDEESVTSVTLPATIQQVGNWAFYSASSLKSVILLGTEAPAIEYLMTNAQYHSVDLYVPKGTSDFYDRTAWGVFFHMYEGLPSENVVFSDEESAISYRIIGEGKAETIAPYMTEFYSGDFTVPTQVQHGGKTYAVTQIGRSSFYNAPELYSLTIPECIDSIGMYAIAYCAKGMSHVKAEGKIPAHASSTTFNGIFNDVNLYVPAGTTEAYTEANGWNKFVNISDGEVQATPIFTLDGVVYRGTPGSSDVMVKSATSSSDIVVPATVEWKGQTYNVTYVDFNAFEGHEAAVVLPASLDSIASFAFSYPCTISSLVMESPVPVTTYLNTILSLSLGNVPVYVPTGCLEAYKSDSIWALTDLKEIGELSKLTHEGIKYGLLEYADDKAKLEVLGCDLIGDIVIPETFTRGGVEYTVTTIGYEAFDSNMDVTAITLPASVDSICKYAFYYASNMTYLKVLATTPPKVASTSAFSGITSKTVLVVPDGCIDTYSSAYGWRNFSSITDDINKMPLPATATVNGIKYNVIDQSYLEVVSNSYIGDIVIPDTVEVVLNRKLPVEGIGKEAFSDRTLGTVTLPNTIKYIGEDAFSFSTLRSICTLESVDSIADYAFWAVDSLKEIHLGKSLRTVGKGVFGACANLKLITVDKANTSFSIVDSVLYSDNGKTLVSYPGGLTRAELTVPEGVTSMQREAITYTELQTLNLPASLNAFTALNVYGNAKMKTINVASDNPYLTSVNGVVYDKQHELITCPAGWEGSRLVVAEGTTKISSNAFVNCNLMKVVELPSSIKTVDNYAFDNTPLDTLYVWATTPPTAYAYSFTNAGKTVLVVPTFWESDYEVTSPWYTFKSIEEADDETYVYANTYYFYNEANDSFLSRGSTWGTRLISDNFGVPIFWRDCHNYGYLEFKDDIYGRYVGIDGSIYVDRAMEDDAQWQLQYNGDGKHLLYNIARESWVYDGGETSGCTLTKDQSKATAFRVISDIDEYNAIINARYSVASELDSTYRAVDMTSKIKNPTMSQNINGWTSTFEATSGSMTTRAGVTEVYQQIGKIHQTIRGLEPGIYKVTLQGFYRGSSKETCIIYDDCGYELSNAYLYANNDKARIKPWASGRKSDTNPNTMEEAYTLFNAGKYNNEVYTRVGEDGKLTIGLSLAQWVAQSWLIWSNATLTYYTQEPDAIEDIIADADGSAEDIYSLSGVKLNNVQKGLNIVRGADGKVIKQLKK